MFFVKYTSTNTPKNKYLIINAFAKDKKGVILLGASTFSPIKFIIKHNLGWRIFVNNVSANVWYSGYLKIINKRIE